MSVCMDKAGSTCQPADMDTGKQRLVVFNQACSSTEAGDGSALW